MALEVLGGDVVQELAELLDLVLLLLGTASPAISRTSSSHTILVPVRSARAIESDGRALISTPEAKTSVRRRRRP